MSTASDGGEGSVAGVRTGGSLRIPAHTEALQRELGLAWPFFVGDGFPCAGPLRAEPHGDAGQAPAPAPKCPGSPAASPPNSPDGGPALTASAPEPACPEEQVRSGDNAQPTGSPKSWTRAGSEPDLFSLDLDETGQEESDFDEDNRTLGLGDLPANTFLLILERLRAADLGRVECVAQSLCWPGTGGVDTQESLPEEAARTLAIKAGLTERRAGESWKQTLAQAERSEFQFRLSAGWRHTAFAQPLGSLLTWGNSGSGRLGLEDQANVMAPRRIEHSLSGEPAQVSAGVNHTLVLTDSGTVLSTGYGFRGASDQDPREDDSDEEDQHDHLPRQLQIAHKVAMVSAGPMHSAAATSSGQLFTWGFGRFGMLGHGNTHSSSEPKLVEGLSGVRQVSCGGLFTAACDEEGQLWTFGTGYIGHGCRSFEQHTPKLIELGERVTLVSCGKDHTAAVTSDGQLLTFGIGRDGRLGHGNSRAERKPRHVAGLSSVERVSCGKAHTAVLLRDGSLLTFGCGGGGRLGHGDNASQSRPKPVEELSDTRCVEVSCGGLHTVALTKGGRLYAFGDGHDGQLGLGQMQAEALLPQRIQLD